MKLKTAAEARNAVFKRRSQIATECGNRLAEAVDEAVALGKSSASVRLEEGGSETRTTILNLLTTQGYRNVEFDCDHDRQVTSVNFEWGEGEAC